MVAKRSTPTIVAAVLLLLLGLARGVGALALISRSEAALSVSKASAHVNAWVALGLLAVALLALASGIWLLRGHAGARALSVLTLVLFVAGGAANGLVLFGAPRPQGVLLNVAYGAVVVSFIVWGQRLQRVASAA
jgi:hypothetical protein